MLKKIFATRFKLLAIVYLFIISVSFLTRLVLFIKSFSQLDTNPLQIVGIFLIGLLNDTLMSTFFLIPFVLYLWLVPNKIYFKKWHRFILYGLCLLAFTILVFNAVSEWFFWDEFSTRYNFIAVDYLIYTTEVVGNIWQSYPIVKLLIGIFVLSILVLLLTKKYIKAEVTNRISFKYRTLIALIFLLLPVLVFLFGSNGAKQFSKNQYASELSGNGMYDFGAAFINNQLDYDKFYKTDSVNAIFSTVKKDFISNNSQFQSDSSTSITRTITYPGDQKNYNLIMISVESLSGDFLSRFGNTEHITPNLDSLANQGLFFSNLFATGTRTVRGLEALSLSLPPTPGQSEVKRPNNEGRFSLGNVLKSKGYTTQYLYGGYGYFDNMNYFFSNNGYDVIDRSAITNEKDIHYENIWGVADEDLFTLAVKTFDANYKLKKPFFSQIMTTSNHRPYTYPEGRIDIPSHTGRSGAVKYTDYAIGKFINDCRNKPWFNNTIFVIVADHCASSAGKTELPIKNYRIPMIVYAPSIIKPSTFNGLTSQIDIPPTLLGMLNVSYTSKFFGFDIFNTPADQRRAFISTYQNLGYYKGNQLIILSPQQKVEAFNVDSTNFTTTAIKSSPALEKEAISYYQSASYLLHHRLYQFKK